jgi:pseudouridine synthase
MQQRLQKALAAAGVASRRHAEALIAAGRVRVDGAVVTTPGTLVDPDTQKIAVDGKPVETQATKHYIALHKPVGYVSTVADRHAPKKVTELVQIPGARLVPAGRLDADSEGLLLLSNDGEFIYRVTHPSQSLGKTYHATVQGTPTAETIRKLARGLMLPGEERETAPAGARKLGRGPEPGTSVVELVLHEGRNRQVRRMLERVGHPVLRLVRVRVGPVALGDLASGAWRELTSREVRLIQKGSPATAAPPAEAPRRLRRQEDAVSTKNPHRGGSVGNETRYRGGSRPGPGQDHRKPAPGRVQVHQDRVNGRLPARGQRDAPDRRGGKGHGALPRPHRRGEQNT